MVQRVCCVKSVCSYVNSALKVSTAYVHYIEQNSRPLLLSKINENRCMRVYRYRHVWCGKDEHTSTLRINTTNKNSKIQAQHLNLPGMRRADGSPAFKHTTQLFHIIVLVRLDILMISGLRVSCFRHTFHRGGGVCIVRTVIIVHTTPAEGVQQARAGPSCAFNFIDGFTQLCHTVGGFRAEHTMSRASVGRVGSIKGRV